MRNLVLSLTLIMSIGMTTFVAYVLADEIRVNRSFGEYSRRSYVIWPLILLVALAGVVVSWVSLPGSKWFVAVFFLPLLLLLALAIRYGEKKWIGGVLIFLLISWVSFGGALASWAVYSAERGMSVIGQSDNDCTYSRVPGTLRYSWICSSDY